MRLRSFLDVLEKELSAIVTQAKAHHSGRALSTEGLVPGRQEITPMGAAWALDTPWFG